jgi:hypothetical protein
MDITTFVAIYAALLSSYLGFREVKKEKRRINIYFEYFPFYEQGFLLINNIGNPKVVISDVSVVVNDDPVPRNCIFDVPFQEQLLPRTLSNGDFLHMPLSGNISHAIMLNKENVNMQIYDIEGNVYKEFKVIIHDPKWGYIDKNR